MLLFTICSILGDIWLGLSTTEISGPVRSRNGQQLWPQQSLQSFIYPMKLNCQYLAESSSRLFFVGAHDTSIRRREGHG